LHVTSVLVPLTKLPILNMQVSYATLTLSPLQFKQNYKIIVILLHVERAGKLSRDDVTVDVLRRTMEWT
jgi:hypothetical protein